MKSRITRRRALTLGVTAAGLAATQNAHAHDKMKKSATEEIPFLSPWSPPADLKRDLTPGPTPVRLAAWSSTTMLNYPTTMSITEMVKRIRDAGYTAANCHPGRLVRNPWLDASEAEIRELKDALKTYDVMFFDMHANANNMHPDPVERKKEQQWSYWEVEAAERVGCPLISTHVGSMAPSAIAPHPDNWTWDTWKLTVQVMKQMIKDTEGSTVAFAIEPDPLVQLNCHTAIKQLMDECGPRVKVCYDPVNMMDIGVYYRTTEFINEGFDLLGEDILCAHAKDSYILPDKMSMYITEVRAGLGTIDYETYLARLSRMAFPRVLLIEHIPDEQYPAAKAFIEDTAAKVGVKIYA